MKKLKKQNQAREDHSSKKIPTNKKEWEHHYEELADFYDTDASLEALEKGLPVSSAQLRALAKSRAKAISLRMPLITLAGAKRIASKRKLPYQRLIIQAVEKLIDEEERSEFKKKKPA